MDYTLELNEPWTFLNARGNPVKGRRLTFKLGDGAVIELDVTKSEYHNPDTVKAKLLKEIAAYESIKAL